MNTRFKLALRLLTSRRNKGFTLMITIMIGAIMLLTGAVILTRASQDTSKVQSQTAKAQGLAVTEVAVSQVRNFLNTYPYLAEASGDQWDNIVADTTPPHEKKNYLTCQGTSSTWTNEKTQIEGMGNGSTWYWVNPSDPNQGMWSLKYYKYDNSDANKPKGIAFIDTIVNYNPATDDHDSGGKLTTSPTRLVLDFYVTPSKLDESGGAPGLWMKYGDANKANIDFTSITAIEGATGTSNNTFSANVWMNCNVPQDSVDGMKVTSGYKAQKVPYQMPNAPAPSSSAIEIATLATTTYPRAADITSYPNGTRTQQLKNEKGELLFLNGTTQKTAAEIGQGTINTDGNYVSNGITYPKATVKVYEYKITGLIEKVDVTVNSTDAAGKRQMVIFHFYDSIDKGTEITHNYVTGVSKPTDLQMFGHKASGGYICINGNNKLAAFILAPTYDAGTDGGGGGKGGVKGSLWVQSYNKKTQCSSSSSNVLVEQTAQWSDLLGLNPNDFIQKSPVIGDVTGYQTVDVTQEPNSSIYTIGALTFPTSTTQVKAPLSLPPIAAALSGGTETSPSPVASSSPSPSPSPVTSPSPSPSPSPVTSPSPSPSPSPVASTSPSPSPSPVCVKYNNGNGACIQWR